MLLLSPPRGAGGGDAEGRGGISISGSSPMNAPIHGWNDPKLGAVREAFATNFADRDEVGSKRRPCRVRFRLTVRKCWWCRI